MALRFADNTKRKDYINCPICGEDLYYITHIHAAKHGITLQEFCEKYNGFKYIAGTRCACGHIQEINGECPKCDKTTPRSTSPSPTSLLLDHRSKAAVNRHDLVNNEDLIYIEQKWGVKPTPFYNRKRSMKLEFCVDCGCYLPRFSTDVHLKDCWFTHKCQCKNKYYVHRLKSRYYYYILKVDKNDH